MNIGPSADSFSSLPIKQAMEEEDESNTSTKCTPKTMSFRERGERAYAYHHHRHHHLLQNSYTFGYGFGFGYQNQYQNFPALLPLPPTIPLQLTAFPQNHTFGHKSHLRRGLCSPALATSSDYHVQDFPAGKNMEKKNPFLILIFLNMGFFNLSLLC